MIAIVVEDGSIVESANSYVSVADLRAFANDRGLSIPVSDDDCAVLLIKAKDLLESKEFQGSKVSANQELQWPRTEVEIDGYFIDSTVIPKQLKNAQCQYAIDAQNFDLQPTKDSRVLIRQKIDVIEQEWLGANQETIFSKAESFLYPLLKKFGAFALTSVRV